MIDDGGRFQQLFVVRKRRHQHSFLQSRESSLRIVCAIDYRNKSLFSASASGSIISRKQLIP